MIKRTAMGIIFSNMHDNDLGSLTRGRTTGSIPYGGRYRLVDFVLSSMVNSGISEVGVVTKSNYQSLMEHLGSGREWDLARKIGGLTILPPYSSGDNQGIYAGRLDALSGVAGYIKNSRAEYVVMADCDVIANLDFQKMIAYHEEKGAEITLAYRRENITRAGNENVPVLDVFDDGKVAQVWLAPQKDGEQNIYLNVAIMKRDLLVKIVEEARGRNKRSFKKDILMDKAATLRIYGYTIDSCLMRINSLQSYYDASMALLDGETRKELFPAEKPILTRVRDQVPAKYGLAAKVQNSLVADGCIVEGKIENSIIFRGAKIGKNAVVKNCVIMSGVVVGDGAHLEYVVADRDATIRDTRTLIGYETYPLFVEKGSMI
ncbi:MAG: glucose-1-phosphate adenylyltransferase subunit GlgD [Oscillospiraceae bacterium]|nr:glucose-1-phosphate adenylyltransferase subunit GlgD [Oscillospiraceae bacterium]